MGDAMTRKPKPKPKRSKRTVRKARERPAVILIWGQIVHVARALGVIPVDRSKATAFALRKRLLLHHFHLDDALPRSMAKLSSITAFVVSSSPFWQIDSRT
jgi:hypothetical protein